MFIDPHVHSSEISLCSHITLKDLINAKKSLGYDGAVLTNHCQSWYYESDKHKENMQRQIDVFLYGKDYAEKNDFTLMLGIEVTISIPRYADFLLYGVTEEFLLSSPCLYTLSQEELYNYCKESGVLLIQAHPYRAPITPMDVRFMDGVEINAQPSDLMKKDMVIDFAKEHNLYLTCGVDFHSAQHSIVAGMETDGDIKTSKEFAESIKNFKTTIKIEGETVRQVKIR